MLGFCPCNQCIVEHTSALRKPAPPFILQAILRSHEPLLFSDQKKITDAQIEGFLKSVTRVGPRGATIKSLRPVWLPRALWRHAATTIGSPGVTRSVLRGAGGAGWVGVGGAAAARCSSTQLPHRVTRRAPPHPCAAAASRARVGACAHHCALLCDSIRPVAARRRRRGLCCSLPHARPVIPPAPPSPPGPGPPDFPEGTELVCGCSADGKQCDAVWRWTGGVKRRYATQAAYNSWSPHPAPRVLTCEELSNIPSGAPMEGELPPGLGLIARGGLVRRCSWGVRTHGLGFWPLPRQPGRPAALAK
jgi:hypothetical protein